MSNYVWKPRQHGTPRWIGQSAVPRGWMGLWASNQSLEHLGGIDSLRLPESISQVS